MEQRILQRLSDKYGISPKQAWNAYLKRWFDYLDRDGDGKLSAQEARYAPRSDVMMQMMRQPQGLFFGNVNVNMRMAEFSKNEDETVTLAEFQRYYQKNRVGATQIVMNQANANAMSPVSDRLFKLLDLDGDGKLSRAELAQADKVLARLDGDDDEMITAQEIAPSPNQVLLRPAP